MLTKERVVSSRSTQYKKTSAPMIDTQRLRDISRVFHRDISLHASGIIRRQIEGIQALEPHVTHEDFSLIVESVLQTQGRLICSGVGKSGHIAKKISATLASTGTPSLYVHPTEASHGDLGMVTSADIVLMLSNSGETKELEDIIAYCARFGIPMIGVVRRAESMLAKAADFPVILPDIPEAGDAPAPTTSTTMMLVWGDTLALALAHRRGFTPEDFSELHPGGKLGSRLKRLGDIMATDNRLPVVHIADSMSDVLIEMSLKSLGCAIVTDDDGCIAGLITDGDLRRHMCANFVSLPAGEVMFAEPTIASPLMLAAEALRLMNTHKFTVLPVQDDHKRPIGLVHMQALLSIGVY